MQVTVLDPINAPSGIEVATGRSVWRIQRGRERRWGYVRVTEGNQLRVTGYARGSVRMVGEDMSARPAVGMAFGSLVGGTLFGLPGMLGGGLVGLMLGAVSNAGAD